MTYIIPLTCLQDVKAGATVDHNLSSIAFFGRDGSAVEFSIRRQRGIASKSTNVTNEATQSGRSKVYSKLSYSSFRGGLHTDDVMPAVWCNRVAEEILWMIQEGSVWFRFAKYLKQGCEIASKTWNPKCMSWGEIVRRVDIDRDFDRLNVTDSTAWEATTLNVGYKLCSTYPQAMYCPKSLSEEELLRASKARSRERIPALVWLHPITRVPLCRASQPKSGSVNQDIDRKVCLAIQSSPVLTSKPLRIIDARPFLNAQANALQGKGYENISSFGGPSVASLAFMDIENVNIRLLLTILNISIILLNFNYFYSFIASRFM